MPRKFREEQVSKILAVRERFDRGDVTDASLIAVVRESSGQEINAAMDDYGQGTEAWSRIGSP
jgi:hypothetical protein